MSDSGLWIPKYLLRAGGTPLGRPGLVMYHTISELTPGVLNLSRTLAEKLATLDADEVIAIASNVNARLIHRGAADPSLHQLLERDLLQDGFRERIATLRRGRTADQTIVFTRDALLLVCKAVLGLRGRGPTRTFDEREFGTYILMLNDLLQGPGGGSDEQLMLSSMASWSFYSPLHMEHVIPRFRRIVNRLRDSPHPALVKAREQLQLTELRFDGMTHDEFQATLFAAYLITSGAIADNKAPVLTIDSPLPSFMDAERVRALFRRRSMPIDEFSDWRFGTWSPDRLSELLTDHFFLHDSTTLRQRPMVRIEGGRFVLPDFRLALERFTFGAYWTLFDDFVGDDRKCFSGAWGQAFEEYVLGILAETYPQGNQITNILQTNVAHRRGEIDAVLTFGDYSIVMEVKSTLLPVEVRSSLNVTTFNAWVQPRLWGKSGVLRQLEGDVLAIRGGLLGARPDRVYPVFVTDEASFQALGVNRYLGRLFDDRFADDATIQPLSVVTTDELEELLSHVGDGLVSWKRVLDRRASEHDGWLWTGQALRNELADSDSLEKARLHPSLRREFREFVDSLHG